MPRCNAIGIGGIGRFVDPMDRAASIRPEDLLEHGAWLRGLARSLVADPQSADDLVQQVFVAAMEHPPRHTRGLRGWLGRVVTNAALQSSRADTRRARREQVASRPEALPSTAELVMAAELQREVVSSVLRLSEPYRTTILLRFHRDLPAARIAELQGVPAATVRSRLKRALEDLRGDLDRQHDGGRGAWIAGLLPFARGADGVERAANPLALFAAGAATKLTLAFLGAAILAAILWTLNTGELPSGTPSDVALARPQLAPAELGDPRDPHETPNVAATSNPAARSPAETVRSSSTLADYRGVVTTVDGTPISGATLTLFSMDRGDWRVQDPLGSTTSGLDGRFRIPVPAGVDSTSKIRMLARADGFSQSSRDVGISELELQIKLTATTDVFGAVLDGSTGEPIEGATVTGGGNETTTDASGHYRVSGVMVGTRTGIAATREGYAREESQLRIGRPEPTEHIIRMRRGVLVRLQVFDASTNAAMPGVHIVRRFARESLGTTDAQGEFELRLVEGSELLLGIQASGFATVEWSWKIEDLTGLNTVRIPMKGLAWIEGTVRDSAGSPVVGSYSYAVSDAHSSGVAMSSKEQVALGLPGHVRWQAPDDEGGSDANGSFEFPVVADDSPYKVQFGHRDLTSVILGPFCLSEPGQRLHLDVQLSKGAKIRGRVRFNGEPWTRGSILAKREDGGVASEMVGDEGEYEFANMPPGRVSLQVRDSAGLSINLPSADLVVEAQKEHQQDFEWSETLGTIAGHVIDTRGTPTAAVNVSAVRIDDLSNRRFVESTNNDGKFSIRVPSEGVYDLTVRNRFMSHSPAAVRADTEDVELVLADVGRLRMRLIDGATREPVRAMNSNLWGLSWRKRADSAFTNIREEIDHDGMVELELPVGIVDVATHLAADGYAPQVATGIAVTAEGNVDPMVIELTRGLDVKLSLKAAEDVERLRRHLVFLLHESQLGALRGPFPRQGGPSNHRLNGVNMWVGDPGLLYQCLEIDPAGSAVLGGLAPGRYTLKSFPDDFVFEPSTIELLGGDASDSEKPTVEIRWRSR